MKRFGVVSWYVSQKKTSKKWNWMTINGWSYVLITWYIYMYIWIIIYIYVNINKECAYHRNSYYYSNIFQLCLLKGQETVASATGSLTAGLGRQRSWHPLHSHLVACLGKGRKHRDLMQVLCVFSSFNKHTNKYIYILLYYCEIYLYVENVKRWLWWCFGHTWNMLKWCLSWALIGWVCRI